MNKTKKKAVSINTEVKVSQWLQDSLPELQKSIFGPAKLTIPKKLRLNVGMMPGKTGQNNRTLGVCYKAHVNNGVNLITLNIATTDRENSERILDILCHEIIHAIDNNENGHGPVFKKMALAIGLEGKMTATTATKKLTKKLAKVVKKIGEFPEQAINLHGLRQDTNRNIKLQCQGTEDIGCAHGFNTNKSRIKEIQLNHCLACGEGEYHVVLGKKFGGQTLSIDHYLELTDIGAF